MMVKALFLDFYGTIVHEDDIVIKQITAEILNSGTAKETKEIASFWWKSFSDLVNSAHGNNFKTQRELEQLSLKMTLSMFHSHLNFHELSQRLFDYWTKPAIFEDSQQFFEKCPVPIYIVSNIDTEDITIAMNYHTLKPSAVITSEDARAYKPNERIFRLALEKSRLNPQDVLHAGDSISSDVKGAKLAGIPSVWINRKRKYTPNDIEFTSENLMHLLDMFDFSA